MGFADQYLAKQKGFNPHISGPPSEHLRFIVVIPAFCEPDITDSLESLWNCDRPAGYTEIIIVVNASIEADEQTIQSNRTTKRLASQWIAGRNDPSMRFYVIDKQNMPVADAGVGLARKTGMDEAIYRFNLINNPQGYILSFDADSLCDSNYFTAIEDTINGNRAIGGFNIYFEHPVSGTGFSENIYRGIIEYELHLRYVNRFLCFTGFPFAHHTVGSCFGVKAETYTAQGGMNKRKAGEDFYFLHKIIPLGQFADIITTRVIPSPRESFRAPFGTGAAVGRYLASEGKEMPTYSPECFLSLRMLFQQVSPFFRMAPGSISAIIGTLPFSLKNFLSENNALESIMDINANSGSRESFLKRFYRWFDAFRIIKYLNYATRGYYEQVPVNDAARRFLSLAGYGDVLVTKSNLELLEMFRRMERGVTLQQ